MTQGSVALTKALDVIASLPVAPITPRGQIAFTVYGLAQAGGSKRPFKLANGKLVVVDANKNAKPWKAEVAAAAREAYSGELLRGPLAVTFTFYRPRPKGHFGSGRNAGVLKDSAAKYPTGKPDALKLGRLTEDALTGIVWHDDAQIVDEYLRKEYGEPARVEITITPLT